MTRLCLIIETPRGGEVGHRFVVSNTELTETTAACAANDAARNAVGATYISVSHQVSQRLPNGAVRDGAERIIVTGVDVRQLKSETIEWIKAELAKLVPKVGDLFESMDWSGESRSMVIGRHELLEWINSDSFQQLPLVNIPEELRPPRRARWKWLLLATVLLITGATAWFLFDHRVSQVKRNTGQSRPSARVRSESQIRELAKEWECSPENVVASLLRASNWDRRQEADGMTLLVGIADGEILTALGDITNTNGSNRFVISPSLQGADGFRRFIEEQSIVSPRDAIIIRRWLYNAWLHFSNMQHAAVKVGNALNDAPTADAVTRLLIGVADIQMDVGVGDHFQEPMTPLFDRQEVMIYGVLENYRQRFEAAGINMAGTGGRVAMPPSVDLMTFVRASRVQHEEIRNFIRSSRAMLTDSAREKKGSQAADAIFEACQALEVLHEHLSQNPKP